MTIATAGRLLAASILLAPCVIGVARALQPQPALTLKLCTADVAFPPLTAPDGSGALQIALRRLADELSIRVDNLIAPRRRCVQELRDGLVDAMFTAYSEERAGIMRFPIQGNQPDAARSMAEQVLRIYRRKGEPVDWDSMRFHALAQRLFPGRIEPMLEPFHVYPVYLAIRQGFYTGHAAAVERLWLAIGRARARGELPGTGPAGIKR